MICVLFISGVKQIVSVLTSQKQPACWYQLVKNDPLLIVVALM